MALAGKTAMHTIVPGEGVGTCRIGAHKQTAVEMFGSPLPVDPNADISGYFQFPLAGVEVAFNVNNEIETLFFHFRSSSHTAFNGTTNLGIGIDSSVEDVIARYGKPSQVTEYTSSRTKELRYGAIGTTFNFKDGLLVDIRVSEPRSETWPDEWPMRPMTDDCSW